MITVIAGTNRPASNTLRVARLVEAELRGLGNDVTLLDLQELPAELFDPSSYAEKPPGFARYQDAILAASGIVVVVPEYNGAYPGVLKYFIDMLKFPESLRGVPAAFVGLGAGEWGGLRPVEQLEMVFQYRSAHLFGKRLFLKHIGKLLDESGQLVDESLATRLHELLEGFSKFLAALSDSHR